MSALSCGSQKLRSPYSTSNSAPNFTMRTIHTTAWLNCCRTVGSPHRAGLRGDHRPGSPGCFCGSRIRSQDRAYSAAASLPARSTVAAGASDAAPLQRVAALVGTGWQRLAKVGYEVLKVGWRRGKALTFREIGASERPAGSYLRAFVASGR